MKTKIALVVTALVALLALLFFSSATMRSFLAKAYANFVLDSQYLQVSCSELPTKAAVLEQLELHKTELESIQRIAVSVEIVDAVDTANGIECAGKGYIEIRYGTHKQREQIYDLLNSDTFFGIPIVMLNV